MLPIYLIIYIYGLLVAQFITMKTTVGYSYVSPTPITEQHLNTIPFYC